DPRRRTLTVVGGGATGTQFLFELDDWLRARHQRCPLNWVFREARPLAEFPAGFARYVTDKLQGRRGTIAVYPATAFLGQTGERLRLAGPQGEFQRTSGLTLLFAGLEPVVEFQADHFGRLWLDGEARPNLWGAGDGVRFPGGFDALTAQAALRKGWRVAGNILAHGAGRAPTAYDYRPGGYFVSLGYGDGVGWLASRNIVLTGLAALAIKEASETALGLWLGAS
ncbi:MAG: pyridine nucleotide-disulfide oxidoreductase, partial [Candidatus Competibacteraceae bacterium]|nr:pyridine nucleotide-disulfide oxidoreductase [Candidatus Competibacteraceae bacterium]